MIYDLFNKDHRKIIKLSPNTKQKQHISYYTSLLTTKTTFRKKIRTNPGK